MILEHFFEFLQGKRHGAKTAMRELEISLRAKDPVTPLEDTEIHSITMEATLAFFLNFLGSASFVWFATRKAPKFLGFRPLTSSQSFCYSSGCASLFGNMMYYESYVASATHVLEGGEERMKMELAKMWRQRNSYVDYTFKERMKEYEANSSEDDEAESSVSIRLFEEDSLACIHGTPGSNMEMSKSPERKGGTVLTRRELHVHRISHRHGRHEHADKAAVL